jgi:predicted Zn finger-like uncharacterized protein
MIRTVQCSSCSTSFPVDPRKVPDDGVYARCSVCDSIFFVVGGPDGASAPSPTVEGAEPEPTQPSFAPPEPPQTPFTKPSFAAEDIGAPAVRAGDGTGTAPASADQWVFETEPEIDPSTLDVTPLDTLEQGMRKAQDETPTFNRAGAGSVLTPFEAPIPEPAVWVPPPPPLATPPAPPAPPKAFTFGKRDPHDKASRLARVLVSDIITYNPERHQRALDGGTLKADFEDEIKKSWGEYVDQVGKELAESTQYFHDALNEILARGQRVF